MSLSQEQIDEFLNSTPQLATLRKAIEDDQKEHELTNGNIANAPKFAPLRQLAMTPLFLNLMALTYVGESAAQIGRFKSLDSRRHHLFNSYVYRQLQQVADNQSDYDYTPRQALKYLNWLAKQMCQIDQSEFFYDRLQTKWLPKSLRRRHARMVGVLIGVAIGIAVGIAGGLTVGLAGGVAFGIAGGIIGIAAYGITKTRKTLRSDLNLADSVRFQWPALHRLLISLAFGIAGGVAGSVAGDLMIGVAVGLAFSLAGIILVSFSTFQYPHAEQVGEGLRRTLRSTLLVGMIGGTAYGLTVIVAFGLLEGIAVRIAGFVVTSLDFGGDMLINHVIMRRTLAQNRFLPKKIIPFLQHMSRLSLLQQIGGGHRFIHLTLRDHIAQPTPTTYDLTTRRSSSDRAIYYSREAAALPLFQQSVFSEKFTPPVATSPNNAVTADDQ